MCGFAYAAPSLAGIDDARPTPIRGRGLTLPLAQDIAVHIRERHFKFDRRQPKFFFETLKHLRTVPFGLVAAEDLDMRR
jgi:hypothetical protein